MFLSNIVHSEGEEGGGGKRIYTPVLRLSYT